MNSSFQLSNNMGELAAALAKFQSENIKVVKAVKGQIGKDPYMYADIEAILDAVHPVMKECELAVSQFPGPMEIQPGATDEQGRASSIRLISLTSVLVHKSGQYMQSTCSMPVYEQKGIAMAQSCGLVLTYMRRYALLGILGLPTTDNDAQSAPAQEQAPDRVVDEDYNSKWQALYQSGDWKAWKSADGWDDLGKITEWPKIKPLLLDNIRDGGRNPGLLAALAHWIGVVAGQKGFPSAEVALKECGWQGAPLMEMTPADLKAAFNVVFTHGQKTK